MIIQIGINMVIFGFQTIPLKRYGYKIINQSII